MTYIMLYVPCKDFSEAQTIASHLIDQKLIACANIVQADSMFLWNNKMRNEKEEILIAKTKQNLYKQVASQIKLVHSYECPCIVAWELTNINDEYKQWLDSNLK